MKSQTWAECIHMAKVHHPDPLIVWGNAMAE